MYAKKLAMLLSLLVVLGLVLTACAPAAEPTQAPKPAATAAQPAQPTAAPQPTKVPAQAEGKLSIYTPSGDEVTAPILKLFSQKHPNVRVDVVRAGTGELLSRVRAEKDNPLGDVFWGGSVELHAANADLFAAVDVPEDANFVMSDPAKKWHAWSTNLILLAFNTQRVKDGYPTTYKELTDAKWKELGKIGLSNPRSSGTAYSIVPALVTLYGWDYMADMLKNAKMTDSSDTMFKWVKDGETAAGFLFESTANDYIKAGAPLKTILTTDGIVNQTDAAAVIAGAKNAKNAELFLNFLASKEAHEVVRTEVKRRSARKDVPPPEGFAQITGLKLIQPDGKWVSNQKDDILSKFDEALAKAGQ